MSDNSQASPLPQPPQFAEWNQEYYDVEVANIGEDVVYHFWPTKGTSDFPNEFARKLEDAFKSSLPADADVRAEYSNREEAAIFMRFNETDVDSDPVPTYYVRVVGYANNPVADTMLRKRLFDKLDSLLSEVFQ